MFTDPIFSEGFDSREEVGVFRKVHFIVIHPDFDDVTFEYDLALLWFYESVKFTPNIIPICIPENDYDFHGDTAWVTGWGQIYEGKANKEFCNRGHGLSAAI